MTMASTSTGTRSLEDVERVVQLAKLDLSDFRPVCQTLTFSEPLLTDHGHTLLLEMEPERAAQLKAGDTFVFRGQPEGR